MAYIVEWGLFDMGTREPVSRIRSKRFKTFAAAKKWRSYEFKKKYGMTPSSYYKKLSSSADVFEQDLISILDFGSSARMEYRIHEEGETDGVNRQG